MKAHIFVMALLTLSSAGPVLANFDVPPSAPLWIRQFYARAWTLSVPGMSDVKGLSSAGCQKHRSHNRAAICTLTSPDLFPSQ
jgi:hypothetical protein